MSAIRMIAVCVLTVVFVGVGCSGAHTVQPPAWALRAERVDRALPSEEIRAILRLPPRALKAPGPRSDALAEVDGDGASSAPLCSPSSGFAVPSGMLVATISEGGFEVAREDGSMSTIPTGAMPAFWRAL